MRKNHDENKDLRLVSRIARIDYSDKIIKANKTAIIGNKTWGRIDYLTHYCGWHFIWDNSVRVNAKFMKDDEDKKTKRDAKKAAKDNTLSNKKKRKQ